MPSLTVITPTILRPSLLRANSSVDIQSIPVQHIVMIDGVAEESRKWNREIYSTGGWHNDFGNYARWLAWTHAKGDYIIYLDDDNFLFDCYSLARVAMKLVEAGYPEVAFIPMLMKGSVFMPPTPPIVGTVDTANIVVKREIGRWPLDGGYEADGKFAASLFAQFKCAYLPHLPPTIVMEKSNHGK